MEQWVGVVFGMMAGYAVARLHLWFDGGWWLSVPLGALGGIVGPALWTEAMAARLDGSTLAGTAVAALLGGAVFGGASGAVRTWLFPFLVSRLARRPSAAD